MQPDAKSQPSDPVVEAYKRDIDRSLLRANLQRSVEERIGNSQQLHNFIAELQRAGREANRKP